MPIVPTTTNTQPAADPLELDSAKTWVLEKLNMLKSENNRHSVDLINNIDSRQYVENSGFISGKDPGTYTNQKRDYITTLLAQPQYTPPNKTAQDLWNQETNKFTSNEINSAINIEARTRINGRVKQVRNGLSMMVENVQDNPYPGNLFDALDNLESYVGTIDQQQQKDYPGYLPQDMTKNMVSETKINLANAYLKGNTLNDPLSTMNDIREKASFYKNLGLNDEQLNIHYQEAAKNYQKVAIKDIQTIISILKDDMDKIHMNGGSIDSSTLARIKPES